ncbi:hypothetical protein C8R42DRAFT_374472 [Lentinula raphanica]|nr:hypothetical protein C8R42DRAFT_374472 [Lentinula raphanica]
MLVVSSPSSLRPCPSFAGVVHILMLCCPHFLCSRAGIVHISSSYLCSKGSCSRRSHLRFSRALFICSLQNCIIYILTLNLWVFASSLVGIVLFISSLMGILGLSTFSLTGHSIFRSQGILYVGIDQSQLLFNGHLSITLSTSSISVYLSIFCFFFLRF